EFVYVRGLGLLVISGAWLGRAAGAAQIWHDNDVTLGEQRHDRAPHMAGLAIPVEQDHRATLPADEIAQSDAVDLGEALGEAGGLRAAPSGTRHSRHEHPLLCVFAWIPREDLATQGPCQVARRT